MDIVYSLPGPQDGPGGQTGGSRSCLWGLSTLVPRSMWPPGPLSGTLLSRREGTYRRELAGVQECLTLAPVINSPLQIPLHDCGIIVASPRLKNQN